MGFKHTTPVFKRCAIPCSHLKETYRQGKRRKANKGRKEKEESEHTKIDRRGRKYEKKKKKTCERTPIFVLMALTNLRVR
jgi:hypothetical protein